MNQQQVNIPVVQQLAQQAANYLRDHRCGTVLGSIRVNAVYALDTLVTVVNYEQAVNAHLQGQLQTSATFIAHLQGVHAQKDQEISTLQAEVRRLDEEKRALAEENRVLKDESETDRICLEDMATQAIEVAEEIRKEAQDREVEITKGYETKIAEQEKARQDLIVHHTEALVVNHRAYEDRLAKAIKEAAKAEMAKINAHKMLVTIMDFALTQQFALDGYMKNVFNLVAFDMDVIRQLRDALDQDPDAYFCDNDEVMTTLATLQEIRAKMQEKANPARTKPGSRVEELGEDGDDGADDPC